MPMYSDKTNAENILHLSEENRKSFVFGAENVVSALCRAISGKGDNAHVAIEAWYGTPADRLAKAVGEGLEKAGKKVTLISTTGLFIEKAALDAYKKKFLTDDPGFGWVNMDGGLRTYLTAQRLTRSGSR